MRINAKLAPVIIAGTVLLGSFGSVFSRKTSVAHAAETPSSTQTLTITRSSFGDGTSNSYDLRDWTAKTTGGTEISGKGEILLSKTTSMQMNKGSGKKTAAIFNTVALPGAITSIKAKMDSGTARPFLAYVSKTAYSWDGSAITYGSPSEKICSTSVTVSSTTDYTEIGKSTAGYSYFFIQEDKTSAAYISEFVIEYTVPAPSKTVSSLVVSGQPTSKSYLAGDKFDPAGLVVTAHYTDSTTGVVTDDVEWTCDPETMAVGTTSVDLIASIGNVCSEVYTVSGVVVRGITSIVVSGQPTSKSYLAGDKFDPAGLVVTAHYTDSTTSVVTDGVEWTCDPEVLTASTTSVGVIAGYKGCISDIYTISGLEVQFVTDETLDLSVASFKTQSEEKVEWFLDNISLVVDKNESTTASNNYLGGTGTYTSTRFYKNSKVSISPLASLDVKKIEFVCTTDGYTTSLLNSSFTNGSVSSSNRTVTVIPVDASKTVSFIAGNTIGVSSMKVTYKSYTSNYMQGSSALVDNKGAIRILGLTDKNDYDDCGFTIEYGEKTRTVSIEGDVKLFDSIKANNGSVNVYKASDINSAYDFIFGIEIYGIPVADYEFTVTSFVKKGVTTYYSSSKTYSVTVAESGVTVSKA